MAVPVLSHACFIYILRQQQHMRGVHAAQLTTCSVSCGLDHSTASDALHFLRFSRPEKRTSSPSEGSHPACSSSYPNFDSTRCIAQCRRQCSPSTAPAAAARYGDRARRSCWHLMCTSHRVRPAELTGQHALVLRATCDQFHSCISLTNCMMVPHPLAYVFVLILQRHGQSHSCMLAARQCSAMHWYSSAGCMQSVRMHR